MGAARTACGCGCGSGSCSGWLMRAVWPSRSIILPPGTSKWNAIEHRLADESGLAITVHHLPPGTSKWNAIEHRLFAFISQNWRATPLVSYRVIVDLIGATTTRTGLSVRCELDPNRSPKGVTVSDAEMAGLNIA